MEYLKKEDHSVDVDKVAKTFAGLLKIPSLSSSRLEENELGLTIYTEWTYDDVTKKERQTLIKTYTVLKPVAKKDAGAETPIAVIPSTPIPYDS